MRLTFLTRCTSWSYMFHAIRATSLEVSHNLVSLFLQGRAASKLAQRADERESQDIFVARLAVLRHYRSYADDMLSRWIFYCGLSHRWIYIYAETRG